MEVHPRDMKPRRTRKEKAVSRVKLALYYVIFYATLGAMCSYMMYVLLANLDSKVPRWTLEESIITANPGLAIRPIPAVAENRPYSLIEYERGKYHHLTRKLDKFLATYEVASANPGQNSVKCDYDNPPKPGQVCIVENNWDPCSKNSYYGFDADSPCLFLKLNKIYGWVPEFYKNNDILPKDMPGDLVASIRKASTNELKSVWLSCGGKNASESKKAGPVEYFPSSRSFPGYFYPYKNDKGYLNPLVAVRFTKPAINVTIVVVCYAWAKNIQHDRMERLGSTSFELKIIP